MLLLVCTTAAPSPSRAQGDRPVDEAVRVTGADDCLHHEAVVERLARWLGAQTVDARLEITLDVALNAFQVSWADGFSRRALGALPGACADRLDAVTLAMAMAIDTLAERLGLDDEAAPTPLDQGPQPSPPAPMPSEARGEEEPPSTGDLPPQERKVRAGGFVEAGTALHVVPGWRAAVAGGAVVRVGTGLSARLGGLWMSEGTVPLGPGAARYRLWSGRADLCGDHALGALALGGCAGVGVGQFTVAGRGFQEDLTARQLWVAAIGRASASYVAGPVRVGIAADLFAPALRQMAHVEDRAGAVLYDRGLAPAATALWLTGSLMLR
jgi:hypothetical protein